MNRFQQSWIDSEVNLNTLQVTFRCSDASRRSVSVESSHWICLVPSFQTNIRVFKALPAHSLPAHGLPANKCCEEATLSFNLIQFKFSLILFQCVHLSKGKFELKNYYYFKSLTWIVCFYNYNQLIIFVFKFNYTYV